MMVVVEGRLSLCWSCKQFDHQARYCQQKTSINNNNNNDNINNNKNNATSIKPTLEPGDHPKSERRMDPGYQEKESTTHKKPKKHLNRQDDWPQKHQQNLQKKKPKKKGAAATSTIIELSMTK